MQILNTANVDQISQLKVDLREATNGQELALSRNDSLTQRIKELEKQVEHRIEELAKAVVNLEVEKNYKEWSVNFQNKKLD